MPVHDRDKTDKTRVRCSAVRGSGSCPNLCIIYLVDIEREALGGMREQLRDLRIIETYVRAYNEERPRLTASAGQWLAESPRKRVGSRRSERRIAVADQLRIRRTRKGSAVLENTRRCSESPSPGRAHDRSFSFSVSVQSWKVCVPPIPLRPPGFSDDPRHTMVDGVAQSSWSGDDACSHLCFFPRRRC
jgi:hypothetical protein